MPHTTQLNARDHGTRLGGSRQRFVESIVGEANVVHVRRTDTKVDVGHWFGRRRVWACVLEQELLLFARGRRPYVERISLAELSASQYNHVTGELVLAPTETAAVKTLRMPPLAALEILAHIAGQDA